MPTRVVTISHATGAGGEPIGRTVADRLGFRYIDEEIITLAAEKEGVDAALVADTERRKGFLARLFSGLTEGRWTSASPAPASWYRRWAWRPAASIFAWSSGRTRRRSPWPAAPTSSGR